MWVIAKLFKIRKQYTGYDRGEDKKEATPVSYAAPPHPPASTKPNERPINGCEYMKVIYLNCG